MRRRRLFSERGQGQTEINLSPLIDMVFILLIFFIVTTVFVDETGVEVDKPHAVSAATLDKKSILIGVTSGGQVMYSGREIGTRGVRPTVQRLLQKETRPVTVQADRTVPTHLLVSVIDQAKLAGAPSVHVSTELIDP